MKPDYKKPKGEMVIPEYSKAPFDSVSVHFMGPFPQTFGENDYLLVFVDNFSKWVEMFPVKKTYGKGGCYYSIKIDLMSLWIHQKVGFR